MKSFYEENESFRQYVDKYCVKHEVTPEQAFEHATVRAAAEYYQKAVVSKTVAAEAEIGADCK